MMHQEGHFVKRILALAAVLLAVSLPYLQLTKAYFVGYDDFHVAHRAAFEDSQQPSRIFTTQHFGSPKYRPLDRLINFISYRVGHGDPFAFRARNLFCHLLNCAVVFVLGILLFDSTSIAAIGAALFGLNPLAHRPVAAAGWTTTGAASLVLIGVVLGLWSYRAGKHELRWLMLAIAVLLIGVLVYEADVSAVGIIFLYFALDTLHSRRIRVRKSWLWTLLLSSMFLVAFLVGSRAVILRGTSQPVAPLAIIAKSAVMYIVALLLPLDPLLANQWFGTPLVSEIPLNGMSPALMAVLGVCGVGLVALVLFVVSRILQRHPSNLCFVNWTFLLGAAGISILPLLVFNTHASESYLYLPVAFTMLLLSSILSGLRRTHPVVSYLVLGLLFASFACATWARSQRVIHSATIAKRILSELPYNNWRQGEWRIRLANAPGYTLPHRYGLYTYQGLDTIGIGDGIASVQRALQLQTDNENGVLVDVLSAQEMSQECSPANSIAKPCFWIYPDGRVEQFFGGLATHPI